MSGATASVLRGLTWDHPRGYVVLEELARLDAVGEPAYGPVPVPLAWSRQPLEGFESHPIAELAETYDVLVVDHPGLADAVASGALLPMEELFGDAELRGWRTATAGPSFDSYHYEGRQWALPLDSATQVCVVRPDLLGADPPPGTWDDVRVLVRSRRIALCLAGPHALMMLLSLCVADGAEPARGEVLVDPEAGARAVDLMAELLAASDRELSLRNPIGVLGAMADGADIACCPLVYGYVTYSRPAEDSLPLRAIDAPRWRPGGRPGSVLGGTGLAVSGRARDHAGVRAHLRRLMSEQVQVRLAPYIGGQPSARVAWTSGEVNERWHGFYRDTLSTLEAAWVRPRRPGWVAFQHRASALVRESLLDGAPPRRTVRTLNELYRRWSWTYAST